MAHSNPDLDLLDKKISELISYCQKLEQENSSLRQAVADAEAQRSQLLTNNASASEQIRQAIDKLQAMNIAD